MFLQLLAIQIWKSKDVFAIQSYKLKITETIIEGLKSLCNYLKY